MVSDSALGALMKASEQQRLDTLYSVGILDTLPSAEFDTLSRLAMGIAGTPIGFVAFIDRDRQWFKSIVGVDWTETERSVSFCTHTVQGTEPLIINDATADPRFIDNLLVTGPAGLRFYAGFPILMPNGAAIGSLAVVDLVPRELPSRTIDSLKLLAQEVTVHVKLHAERLRHQLAENDNQETQRRLAVLLQNLPGMAFRCKLDSNWTMEFVSDGAEALTGYPPERLTEGKHLSYGDLILGEDRQMVRDAVHEGLCKTGQFKLTYRIRRADGQIRWVWEQGSAVTDAQGRTVALEGFITDVTAQKKAEQLLQAEEQRLRFALEGLGDGIWDQNLAENKIYLSSRCKAMLGYAESELGTSMDDWTGKVHPEDLPHLLGARKRLFEGEDVISTDVRRQHKDGSWRLVHTRGMVVLRDEQGKPVRMIGTYSDVTDERDKARLLQTQATTDSLTSLPNRRLFMDRLSEALRQAEQQQQLCAVLFIDLDGFKQVNDMLGHEQGDHLLVKVAQRLAHCIRETDTVARLGGDEFTIILTGVRDVTDITKVAQTIVDRLAEPYRLLEQNANISASIGIAVYPSDGVDTVSLMRRADAAMYRAKQLGKRRISF